MQIKEFKPEWQPQIEAFFTECLPQCGRVYEPETSHSTLRDIPNSFEHFNCLFDENKLIGTSALRPFGEDTCELKCVYLLQDHHGRGLGRQLVETAIAQARESGYKVMLLDTIRAVSANAIALYHKLGFVDIEAYHKAQKADLFMKLILQEDDEGENQ